MFDAADRRWLGHYLNNPHLPDKDTSFGHLTGIVEELQSRACAQRETDKQLCRVVVAN